MKVFLTGGTGFIGQALTQALLLRGWEITALVRQPTSPQGLALAKMGVKCLAGDITNRESMREGMQGADIVVHNAAWYEIGMPKSAHKIMHNINVEGTDNVLSLAQELTCPRIIYVSSIAYYGDTCGELRDERYQRQKPYCSYYEQTKAEAHKLALNYQQQGLPLTIVCPANTFGTNDHAIYGYYLRMYVNNFMTPFAFSAQMMLSPVHVADVGEGITLAAEKGKIGETYILAGDTISLKELFDIWNTQAGGFKIRMYIPRWLGWLLFAPMEPILRFLGLPAFISRECVEASAISYHFSSRKAQQELGWTYRPFKDVCLTIIDEERKLAKQRTKRDLVSLLKPIDTILL